ncbi:MAG: hypothetical protein PHP62_03890 [Candidatus Moranbacteria bacterium]|nr:hypothetical protein [Candidatus Moranbacteria bacterium]
MNKRFIRAVGALHNKEVENILVCSDVSQVCVSVDLQMLRKFPEKFLWKDDEKIMTAIEDESSEGPFLFIVLIFK